MSANGLFQFTVENLNPSGTEKGIIGKSFLYQKDGYDLVELASAYKSHGSHDIPYIAPGESPTSKSVSVSGGTSYYIKVPKYSNHAAPYELKTNLLTK